MDEDLKFFMHTCSNSHVQPIIRHGRNITAATRQALVCKKNEYDGAISKILYQPPQYNVTVQQIFRRYGKHYLDDKNSDNLKKRIIAEVVRNLVYCRTPAMGTHYQSCTDCKAEVQVSNSCFKHYCNLCSGVDTAKWCTKREREIVNTQYHHCVFTVPAALNPYFLANPVAMYNALFQAVIKTIQAFARDGKYLGGTPGFICVLHTWGQTLCLHPHVHVIITAGGLSPDRTNWVTPKSTSKDFLFPVKAMSKMFRGKFMETFLEIFKGQDLSKIKKDCYAKQWCVYTKPAAGGNPEIVIKYLSRYAYRVAINNSRLISCDDGKVTFRYHNNRGDYDGEMTLSAEEFMRRYLLHVLPSNFRRIRYCGFLSSASKKKLLPIARKLTETPDPKPLPDIEDILESIKSSNRNICPFCGTGHLVPTGILDMVRRQRESLSAKMNLSERGGVTGQVPSTPCHTSVPVFGNTALTRTDQVPPGNEGSLPQGPPILGNSRIA